MFINHLLTGMILQAVKDLEWLGSHTPYPVPSGYTNIAMEIPYFSLVNTIKMVTVPWLY